MNFGQIDGYILFGGGELLCKVAKRLKATGYKLDVVTSKRHSTEPVHLEGKTQSFADYMEDNGLKYSIVASLKDNEIVTDLITEHTVGISFGAAWIFESSFIDLFKGRLLNCHGARLPKDRGAGGFSWRIMNDDRLGVSLVHQIEPGIDNGAIVVSSEYVFPPHCRKPIDYQEFAVEHYENVLLDLFDGIKEKRDFNLLNQQEAFSSYWPRLATDLHGFVDWTWSLTDIERFICAFDDMYAGASTFCGDQKVRLKSCVSYTGDGTFHPFQNGLIYRAESNRVFVAAQQGALVISKVLNEEGKNIVSDMKIGDRFYTPPEHLQNAMQSRAIYSPAGLKK